MFCSAVNNDNETMDRPRYTHQLSVGSMQRNQSTASDNAYIKDGKKNKRDLADSGGLYVLSANWHESTWFGNRCILRSTWAARYHSCCGKIDRVIMLPPHE